MSHGETHFKIPKQKKKKGYVLGIQKMRPSRDAFERIMVWYNSPDQLILYPMVNGISVRFQTVTEKGVFFCVSVSIIMIESIH